MNEDWAELELIEDGQPVIPIQHTQSLSLREVLKSIHLSPDINLSTLPPAMLSKLVERMPDHIFERLHQKYGQNKRHGQNAQIAKCVDGQRSHWRIGQRVEYECHPRENRLASSDAWHKGTGVVHRCFKREKDGQDMVSIQLGASLMDRELICEGPRSQGRG